MEFRFPPTLRGYIYSSPMSSKLSQACDIMKSKNFLILLLFSLVTGIAIWLISNPTPNIRTIVTETHKHIKNFKLNRLNSEQNDRKRLVVDETYLKLLGFVDKPRLYPKGVDATVKLPIIGTAVSSKDLFTVFPLIDSVRKYLPEKSVVVFDLGLKTQDVVELKQHCNTSTKCHIKTFKFEKFPGHIRNLETKAYKPIALQELLNQYGAVFWSDTDDYFLSGNFTGVIKVAEKYGVAGWQKQEPTSAFTYYKMFSYLKTKADNYHFHHMIGSDHLLLYNLESIHRQLMLPWVQCALTSECIWPTGSQPSGCNPNRKPLYVYSGCHRFANSALNVILGLMFKYESELYGLKTRTQFFGVEEEVRKNVTGKPTTRIHAL